MNEFLLSLPRSAVPKRVSFAGVALLALLAASTARADWPDNNTNLTKWVQGPDPTFSGFDVMVGATNATGNFVPPIILANDFLCRKTGPITDIHIWGSWFGFNGSTTVPPIPISLGIWSDVPAVTNAAGVTPSHPGQLLWSNLFTMGLNYTVRPWKSADEYFWNPDQTAPMGIDTLIWQYNFYPPTNNTFTQTGTLSLPVTYWLSMTTPNQAGGANTFFGWKTATNVMLDNSVFGHLDPVGNPIGDWKELTAPNSPAPRSLDLSFAITTSEIQTNPPPPPLTTNKWAQLPNQFGYDINASYPFVVADDFQCTNAGPITNIQIWASFADDRQQVDPNLTFVLGIWSDIPKGGNTPFSRPGRLLCSNVFNPGDYAVPAVPAGLGQEFFYDPITGATAPETRIWLYNFDLKNVCCQQGSINSPITYWLSVSAISANGTTVPFGWKTSTNTWNDDAVFGRPSTSGTLWQELYDPRATIAKVSLDMAFVINSGPPNPDCEPTVHRKWFQPPDTSPNGLDVLATATNVMGDDFLCRSAGPISGISIFGSWLNDLRDTNAQFQLSLWTDVPAGPATGQFSHPGSMICQPILFNSPQTVGTSLQRYNVSLYKDKLTEGFYDPDLVPGIIGSDTQIWRYDFYPFQPSCWHQDGSPFTGGKIYWIVLDYLPPAGAVTPYRFGWKTSALAHRLDDAVYGHLDPNNIPLGDWKDLRDPRTNTISKDLAFALYDFPVTGINKDVRNTTTQTFNGIQLTVAGFHVITWHYDGSSPTGPWPSFQVTYSGGNTILQWSDPSSAITVAPNAITHVGFEMGSPAKPAILAINWLNGATVVQPPAVQANFHWLNNGSTLVLVNDIALAQVAMLNGSVEWHSNSVPLDQMVLTGTRTPIRTDSLQPPSSPAPAGGAMLVPLPSAPPPGAQYAMFMINLSDPGITPSTTDFVLLPLDSAMTPVIDSIDQEGSNANITWSSTPGRTYHLQYKTDLSASGWSETDLGDIPAISGETSALVPITPSQSYYRVELLPQ